MLVAALLYECGDHQNLGRNILEDYTKDVNGHFAAYAHHMLNTESTPETVNDEGIIWLQPTDQTINEADALSLMVISNKSKATLSVAA